MRYTEQRQWAAVLADVLLERGMPVEYVERVKLALDPETLLVPPEAVNRWLNLRSPVVGALRMGEHLRDNHYGYTQFVSVPAADSDLRDMLLKQVANPLGIPSGSEDAIKAQHRAIQAGLTLEEP